MMSWFQHGDKGWIIHVFMIKQCLYNELIRLKDAQCQFAHQMISLSSLTLSGGNPVVMVIFPDVDNIEQIAKNYKVTSPREHISVWLVWLPKTNVLKLPFLGSSKTSSWKCRNIHYSPLVLKDFIIRFSALEMTKESFKQRILLRREIDFFFFFFPAPFQISHIENTDVWFVPVWVLM